LTLTGVVQDESGKPLPKATVPHRWQERHLIGRDFLSLAVEGPIALRRVTDDFLFNDG
jgi:hypothetical protein